MQIFLTHIDRTPDDSRYDIDSTTGCWNYKMSLDREGYGIFAAKGERKSLRAHRYYYEKYKGKIPKGLDIDHLCRNKACVNPEHLEAVTRGTNLSRGMVGKNWVETFRKFHDKNGQGGSSKWLVNPNTVEVFILGILKEEWRKGYQRGVYEIKARILEELEKIKI